MVKEVFTEIYEKGLWHWNESFSGPGSELFPTKNLVKFLPTIFIKNRIHSVFDIGCGDFLWMQHVNLTGVSYVGGDIVDQIIKHNSEKYSKDGVSFVVYDLLTQIPPNSDLLILRDVLFHLSIDQIKKSLENIKLSNAKYLLVTTHDSKENLEKYYDLLPNSDITPGDFRPIDLTTNPFNLPEPKFKIEEAEVGKYLGFWEISDLL